MMHTFFLISYRRSSMEAGKRDRETVAMPIRCQWLSLISSYAHVKSSAPPPPTPPRPLS